MCAGRESNPGLVRGRDVYYHCTTGAEVFVPRFERGISRVLGERHNQARPYEHKVEYLGFDPSTSSLLRTHASDCANTPCDTCGIRTHAGKAHSLSRRAP